METERKQFDRYYCHMRKIFQTNFYKECRMALEKSYAYCSGINKLATLLDVGCHSGVFHLLYDKYFSKIELADVVDQRATFVVGRFPFHILSLNSDSLPSGIEQFDFINCLEVLEHIPDERKAMANLSNLLRPGGYLLLSTPNRLRIYERIKSSLGFPTRFPTKGEDEYFNIHYREYSVDEITNLFKNFGFEIKNVQTVIASIGPVYLPFWKGFPDRYKKNIVLLAQKQS